MVSPSAKRRAVKISVEEVGSSTAMACRALGLSRSGYYRVPRESVEGRRVRKELVEMSRKHPRYGYRRITALLRREGFEVNPKRWPVPCCQKPYRQQEKEKSCLGESIRKP